MVETSKSATEITDPAMLDSLPTLDELNRASEPISVRESKTSYPSPSPSARGFKGLAVWQHSIDFVAKCYQITGSFPKTELYGLTRQLREAAVSVSLNISEGFGRNNRKEFARFCDIARGSLQEVDTAFEISIRLGYIDGPIKQDVQNQINVISAMLLHLARHLRENRT
jgi:four helix bundle protein